MNNWKMMGLAAVVLGIGMVGCTPQARDQYDKAGENLGQATKETGNAVATDAKATGEAVKDGVQEGKKAVDNSMMTGQVRTAISAAHDLKIEDLNVDTVGNKVILKGNVATQAEKDQAQKIAEGQVGKDFQVDNQLTVGGAANTPK